jgi:hypothetical protein
LATITGIYVWRGMAISRRERLRPLWRLGPVLGLLYVLPSLARAWGRLSTRRLHTSPSAGLAAWSLRSAGGGTFFTEHVTGGGRAASLEGLRHRLQTTGLRPKAPSEWDEADIICNSALFWRVRMVSYEAWGTLYLRLIYRPRLGRLAVPALGIALALLLYPFAAAAAIGGLLAILLLERWIFARRLRRILAEDPKEGSRV